LVDAFQAFQDKRFLKLAEKNAVFLKKNVMQSSGKLYHIWKSGKSSVDGFMEDYAFLIQAYLSLFEVTGNENWLKEIKLLFSYAFTNFYNRDSGMFYFKESVGSGVITNYFQNEDNVIPGASSVMAHNLHKFSLVMGLPDYLNDARKMMQQMNFQFAKYPMAYANWGHLLLKFTEPCFEIVVIGEKAKEVLSEMQSEYRPNVLWSFSISESDVPILKNRFKQGKTLIYVCRQGACRLPVESSFKAKEMIRNNNEKR